MEKLTIFLFCLQSLTLSAQQRPGKFSFYVQGGYMSSGYVYESARKRIHSATETDHHKCIILNAGFFITLNEKWRIGPAFTYDHFGTKLRSVEYSNLNYMLRCDRTWKTTKKYLLYSGLALGVKKIRRFEEEKETNRKVTAAYQLYLLGAEYKLAKWFSLNISAGYGVSGILNAGGRFQF